MANTHLIRTISTPSTNSSYTLSMWFKLNQVDIVSSPYIWSHGGTASTTGIYFGADNKLKIYSGIQAISGTTLSDGALRDCNGWYHFVFSVNSGTATTYINGVQQSGTATNIPALNGGTGDKTAINAYTADIDTYDILDISFSHIHFIDGTAYDASAFGETDVNGVWKIKTNVSVTYGNIGYFIFKDGTNLSGSTVQDQSGNGNNFTVAGGTGSITQTEDNPSNVFATWNPLVNQGVETYSNGNTTIDKPIGGDSFMYSTLGFSSGKYYFEYKLNSFSDNSHMVGFWDDTRLSTGTGFGNGVYLIYAKSGNANSITAYGTTVQSNLTSFSAGDIIGVAIDYDNGTVQFYRNGSTYGSQVTGLSSNLNGKTIYFGAFGEGHGSLSRIFNASANFGNGYFGTTAVSSAGTNASGIGIFEYDVPTGYTALSTKGLNL